MPRFPRCPPHGWPFPPHWLAPAAWETRPDVASRPGHGRPDRSGIRAAARQVACIFEPHWWHRFRLSLPCTVCSSGLPHSPTRSRLFSFGVLQRRRRANAGSECNLGRSSVGSHWLHAPSPRPLVAARFSAWRPRTTSLRAGWASTPRPPTGTWSGAPSSRSAGRRRTLISASPTAACRAFPCNLGQAVQPLTEGPVAVPTCTPSPPDGCVSRPPPP